MLLLLSGGVLLDLPAQNEPTLTVDSNYNLTVRSFDTNVLKQYANNPEFSYERKPPRPSFLNQLWQWIFGNKIGHLGNTLSETWRLVRYIVVFLLVCLVVRQLLKANIHTLFFRSPAPPSMPYEVLAENIHEINFEEQLQAAIAQQDYRKAVRLHYLKTLKTLTDKALIKWTADKTNQRYVYELQKRDLQQPFKELTYLFDYVWYGDFALNQETFSTAQHQFTEFQQQIQQHI